jgi:hypothetical protein
MSRKSNLSETLSADNGEALAADALDFDPAKLDATSKAAETEIPDPFNVESLRVTGATMASLGVKEALVTIRCRKPNKEEWVRVHPSEDYCLETYVIELKTENEIYLLTPVLWPTLAGEPTLGLRRFFTAQSYQGETFLWPCRLPTPDGKLPDWVAIPLEAARMAKDAWVRISWDEAQRKHRIWEAEGQMTEPRWPDLPLNQLLKLCFKDRFIQSLDHPILKKLRGEGVL